MFGVSSSQCLHLPNTVVEELIFVNFSLMGDEIFS